MIPARSTTKNSADCQLLLALRNDATTNPLATQAADLIGRRAAKQFRSFAAGISADLPALRFNRQDNCLHKAIACRSMDIVSFLLDPVNGWAQRLVNHRDIAGRTPLRCAVETPWALGPELVDALLNAGAEDNLSEMLAHCVMRKDHEPISKRLIAANAHPSYAMAWLYNQPIHCREHAHEAMSFLRSQGFDNAPIFKYAIEHRLHRAVALMTLLGHDWSGQFTRAAWERDEGTVQFMLRSGMDYSGVITKLITDGSVPNNSGSKTFITLAFIHVERRNLKLPPTWEKEALFWFDRRGMSTAVSKLGQWAPYLSLSLREIARCSVATIDELLEQHVVPKDSLEELIRTGHLVQARRLVAAGVPTAPTMDKLPADVNPKARRYNVAAARLLVLAGADPQLLTRRVADPGAYQEYRQIRERVRRMKPSDVGISLALFPWEKRAGAAIFDELAMILDKPENVPEALAMLKALVELGRPRAAATIINCGLNAAEALKETVSVTEPDWTLADSLVRAANANTYPDEVNNRGQGDGFDRYDEFGRHAFQNKVLLELTLQDKWDVVRKFIPRLTDGSWAILECVLRQDAERMKRLHYAGADIIGAFIIAIKTKRYEAAARVMAYAPFSLDNARLRALHALTLPNDIALAEDVLMLRGIDLTLRLQDAVRLKDEKTAKHLLQQHPEAGITILEVLSRGASSPAESATLQFLLDAGLDPSPLVEELARDREDIANMTRLRNLDALGLMAARNALKQKIFKP